MGEVIKKKKVVKKKEVTYKTLKGYDLVFREGEVFDFCGCIVEAVKIEGGLVTIKQK